MNKRMGASAARPVPPKPGDPVKAETVYLDHEPAVKKVRPADKEAK